MIRPVALLAVCLWSACLLGTAAAQLPSDAEQAFARGDFLLAARLGVRDDTAAGLALAARATLVYAEFEADPAERHQRVGQARHFARTALERDAGNVEAHIQMAAVIGYLARQEGAVSAHFQGLAHEGRGYLERALALAPDDPWANAVLGAWHLEVVNQGGEALASMLYGASVDQGIASFEKALAAEPGNPTLYTEFAIALLMLDAERYLTDGSAHLRRALTLEPHNALDGLQRQRARVLLTAAEQDDIRKLAREIRRIRDMRRIGAEVER